MITTKIYYKIGGDLLTFDKRHRKSVDFDTAVFQCLPITMKALIEIGKSFGYEVEIVKAKVKQKDRIFVYTPELSYET